MRTYELVFGIPLLLGMLLVLCSALAGADGADLHPDQELEGDLVAQGPLSLLGVGRVPLVVVAMLLLLLFGGAGLVLAPSIIRGAGETLGLVLAFVLAAAASLLGTGKLGQLIARYLPSAETYAPDKHDLLALQGTVLVVLGPQELVARVMDRGGAEQRVRCVITGPRPPIGALVVLVAYDKKSDRYTAEPISA